ncbi:outer membrane beta-barrel protein [Helicobacter sp. MIT 05-5293]|uniref:outer membrane beta-barrel protein n=1 Tax=Helicobacter sp. MIT 05-5293 TaxID=1548149 RepID=UPI00051D3A1A|nr:outer membrane beta-barrel protein [Helicobacter sp. MIT 05-5293]TLD82115.1 outer membrane beta-barrel protein [Helicobacter sp. MIT 05-5293]
MRKKWGWVFYLLMSLGIFELRAGESGLFLGGSLSLENAHYDGLFITQSAGPMRYYPHSNDSKNHIGFALRGGYQFFTSDARLGARIYFDYQSGSATYKDEMQKEYLMDTHYMGFNADLLFEILQVNHTTLGVFAGGGYSLLTHQFKDGYYTIHSDNHEGAKIKGSGWNYQAGISLTIKSKHRIEWEMRYYQPTLRYESAIVSGYVTGANPSMWADESISLRISDMIVYRLNYVYVF